MSSGGNSTGMAAYQHMPNSSGASSTSNMAASAGMHGMSNSPGTSRYISCDSVYSIMLLTAVICRVSLASCQVLCSICCCTICSSIQDLYRPACCVGLCQRFTCNTVGGPWWVWSLFRSVAFPSVLWCCWLGLLTCKTVSQITYTVFVETLNPAQSNPMLNLVNQARTWHESTGGDVQPASW